MWDVFRLQAAATRRFFFFFLFCLPSELLLIRKFQLLDLFSSFQITGFLRFRVEL